MTEYELLVAATDYDAASAAFRNALLEYVASLRPNMTVYNRLYYPLLDSIREVKANARNSAKAVNDGIQRFCWKVAVGELKIDWEDVCVFFLTLNYISDDLQKCIYYLLPDQVSTDGEADFVEAIPLAGPKVVKKIGAGSYRTIQELYADIKAWLGKDVDIVCDEPVDGSIYGNETLLYTQSVDALVQYYRQKERSGENGRD